MSTAKQLEKISVIPQDEPSALVPVTPMDMLNRAVSSGASLEMVEKLMTLQERWDASLARKQFDAAVSAAKAEIPAITRNATGHNSKRYADFAAIAKVVDPIIGKHGLSYRFRTTQNGTIAVTCILSHKAGHSEETTLCGPADKSGNKNDIQAIGSTLTYLQRYSLVQMLGLAAAADDDGKAAANVAAITQKQADDLRDIIDAKGKDRKAFLKWAKVDRIEDIPADCYEACVNAANYEPPKKA
ncbi:MAG: ERF family protein [Arenimonas sp.]|jgi:hypothetical protein